MNPVLKRALPHLLTILGFVVLSSIYFYPQLQGKVIQQGDIVSFEGMVGELTQYKEATGEQPKWSNGQFGGMPMFQTGVGQQNNLVAYVQKAFHLFLSRPIGYFVAAMLSFYIMMLCFGSSTWLSALGALAFGFTTNQMVLYEAGHTSKFMAIAYSCLIIGGFYLGYVRKKLWLGAAVFTLGLALELIANHVQMTYYLFLTMVIWGVMLLVESIREKTLPAFLKTTGVFLIGVLLAVGSFTSRLWPTYEYQKDTMRGDPILEADGTGNSSSSSETDGLAYDYAMQWSNGALDVAATLVPKVVGGGSGEAIGDNLQTYNIFRRSGMPAQNGKYQAPMYWGKLPFTSGPVYYGAAIFFLFVLGLILHKSTFRWWVVAAVAFTFLLSLGSNLDWFQKLFFNNLPLYNKFRAPSSVLSITAVFFPIMAVIGLKELFTGDHTKQEKLKAIYWAAGSLGAICLFFLLLGGAMFDFSSPGDARYANTGLVETLIADRKTMMRNSAWRSLLIIAIAAGLLWAYVQDRMKMMPVLGILGLVAVGDLWLVDRQYLGEEDFVAPRNYEANFSPRPVDQQILTQEPNRGAYRVLDLSVNTFNSSSTSYFHNTIGGYHPAKLQRYQDLIDRHISQNNQQVLAMLNAKYIIRQDQTLAVNPEALGNAWFVETIRMVNSANEEIDALSNFNAATEAIVHQEFSDYVAGFDPVQAGVITLASYFPDHLVYESNAPEEQFAVFSEIWYGPNKGWQAYIDGEPVEHIRVNYALRGMRVPAGRHRIEFIFDPKSYRVGEQITLASSLLLVLGSLGIIGKAAWDYAQHLPEPQPKPAPKPKPTPRKPAATAPNRKKKGKK